MAINLSGLTQAQREKLKKNNPSLYQANVETLGGSSKLGSKNIEDITKEDLAKAFAKKGKGKSKEIAKSMVTQAETGKKETSAPKFDPEQSAERINNFSAALNVAIDEARQQRKDSTLDLVGGMAPAGALPATSFAGVLSAFNASSAPLESALISGASDHARDMEKFKANESVRVAEQAEADKQYIRDLALTVATETGDAKTAELIMTHGDRDDAVKAALTALGSEYYAQDGAIKKTSSKDGEEDKVISEFKSNLPDSGYQKYFDPTLNALSESARPQEIPESDMDFVGMKEGGGYNTHINLVKAEGRRLMGDATYKKIDESPGQTNDWMRAFLNDWLVFQEAAQQPVDAWVYFSNYWEPAKTKLEEDKGEGEKKDDELSFDKAWNID